jgi:hypothetical protein
VYARQVASLWSGLVICRDFLPEMAECYTDP